MGLADAEVWEGGELTTGFAVRQWLIRQILALAEPYRHKAAVRCRFGSLANRGDGRGE